MGTSSPRTVPLEALTGALVQHVRECFADYAEVDLAHPPTTAPAAPRAGAPRLLVEVRGGHTGDAADRRVLVLCECAEDVRPDDPPAGSRRRADGRPVDVVQVRRASEIAGAVAESTAGDLPLVVDVRLSRADVEALLGAGSGRPPATR